MNLFVRLGAPAMTFAAIVAFNAMTANRAEAGEFCRQDVTGHMTGCGYSTLEQCKAASAGIGGDCFRDPNLKPAGSDSFAYAPKNVRAGKGGRTGNTNSAQ